MFNIQLTFYCMPALIIEDKLDDSIKNLNRFYRKTGVSKHLSPLTIVTSLTKLDFTKLKLSFGENSKAHKDNGYQSNITKTRGAPTITLNPVHDSSGSYYFYSLVSGCRLARD